MPARSGHGVFVRSPHGVRGLGGASLGDLLLVHNGASFEAVSAATVMFSSTTETWFDATAGLEGDMMIHSPRIIRGRLFGINNARLVVWNEVAEEWIPHPDWDFMGAGIVGSAPGWEAPGTWSGHGFTEWDGKLLTWANKTGAATLSYFDFDLNAWINLDADLPITAIQDAGAAGAYILLLELTTDEYTQEILLGHYSLDGESWSETNPICTYDLGEQSYIIDHGDALLVAAQLLIQHPSGAGSWGWPQWHEWTTGTATFTIQNTAVGRGQVSPSMFSTTEQCPVVYAGSLNVPAYGATPDTEQTAVFTVANIEASGEEFLRLYINTAEQLAEVTGNPFASEAAAAAALKAEAESLFPEIAWSVDDNEITAIASGFRFECTVSYERTGSGFGEEFENAARFSTTADDTTGLISSPSAFKRTVDGMEFVASAPGAQVISLASRSALLVGTDGAVDDISPPNGLYQRSGGIVAPTSMASAGTAADTDDVTAIMHMAGVSYLSGTYPVLTVTSPDPDEHFDEGVEVDFIGSATDAIDGDLTASILWEDLSTESTLGTGGTVSTSSLTVGTHTIRASVANSQGNRDESIFDIVIDEAGGGGLTISSIAPDSGPTAGGDSCLISGTGFTEDTDVEFDGTPAASVLFINSTTLIVDTPAHAAGAVDVTVIEGAESDTLVNGYTYS